MDASSNNDKHTAELSHIVKGKVRAAVPLWLIGLCGTMFFGLLMVIVALLVSAGRNAYGASPNYQGVTVGPSVNQTQTHHRRARPIIAAQAIDNSTPCPTTTADNQLPTARH
jgi:hypothetical protein